MSHRYLTRDGYILNKRYLTTQQLQKIRKDLTVTPRVLPAFKEFAKPKPYRVYTETPDKVYLPRYYGIKHFGPPLNSSIKEGKPIRIRSSIQLRPHQHAAAKALQARIDNGEGGVLSLPCGYGKTVLAIWTIAQHGMKTLVVVNKEFLMDQWLDSIEKFTNARTGIIQQNKIEVDGTDIVVAMLHSLCLKDYPPGIFDDFNLVIFDETHHLSSEMFSKALPKVAAPIGLGLSATPERKDGLSCVFYHYLGDLFHSERRKGTNTVIVKQIEIMSSSPYYTDLFLSNGTKNTTGMISQLAEFPERNKLLLYTIGVLLQQGGQDLTTKTYTGTGTGRTILVLSSRREHLEEMYEDLLAAKFRKPDGNFATFGLYYGKQKMNKKAYKKMLEESAKCDIVLGTCQLAQEGLDIPTLNTLLFATPMTDVIQAVGRILRKYHKDINPMVVDIVDKCGNFPKHSGIRRKFYKDEGYVIEKEKILLHDTPADNQYETQVKLFLDGIPDMPDPDPDPEPSKTGDQQQQQPKIPVTIVPRNHPPRATEEDYDSDDDTFNPLKNLPTGCAIAPPPSRQKTASAPQNGPIMTDQTVPRDHQTIEKRRVSRSPPGNPNRIRIGARHAGISSAPVASPAPVARPALASSPATAASPATSSPPSSSLSPVRQKSKVSRRFF